MTTMQLILLVLTIAVVIISYFVYSYLLFKLSDDLGLKHPMYSFIPFLNKFVLVQISDIYEDGKMYIPVIKTYVSRNLIAVLDSVVVFLFMMTPVPAIGYAIGFFVSLLIWIDIESDFAEVSNFEILFDACCCSIGIHAYPVYILAKYRKLFLNEKLLSQSENDYADNIDKYEDGSNYSAEYDDRDFNDEEEDQYSVYTDDDMYSKNVQEILHDY